MLKYYRADLHIHTCLSPCGDVSISPRRLVQLAVEKQIDIIAVCDHNSAENVESTMRAARGLPIVVLPGMEICTQEEIHFIALFEKVQSVLELQDIVYLNLKGENDPETFGLQIVANENDEVLSFNNKLLIGAVDLSINKLVDIVHKLGGIAIASHIDRESYSIIGQLGFIPDDLNLDALEISKAISPATARAKYNVYAKYPFIQNSDAHSLETIGECTTEYYLASPSFKELMLALSNKEGRKVGR